ncbi:uncharacterized protein LOC129724060 [Wyeomyia smithii]|uniref:uncharacterized protein LOC129724060 n=1 Tax=Wyeomyia smithii TaxID=174621 RepID=UPI002467E73D|nr:uncharacterized protein LOC129724060 [Wyeomyia smithii]
MIKLLVVICALAALAAAVPVEESNGPAVEKQPVPEEEFQPGDQAAGLESGDAAKEDLEKSETFGFGYRYYYPRYYAYPRYYYPGYYYSYYPSYYTHYPRYYYW